MVDSPTEERGGCSKEKQNRGPAESAFLLESMAGRRDPDATLDIPNTCKTTVQLSHLMLARLARS